MPLSAQAQEEPMEERYYLTEYIQMWVVGDGTYTLIAPALGGRQVTATSALLIGNWSTPTGKRTQALKPTSAKGRSKDTAVVWVLTETSHHTAIAADERNNLLPFTPADLDNSYNTLTAKEQSDLSSFMESSFMDDTWIGSRPLRDVISYMAHTVFSGQQLGPSYPNTSLSSVWNSLSVADQTAINTLLENNNKAAIVSNITVRSTINKLAEISFGPINFGNETFYDWTP